ncbi:unnamed protein product [Rhodiola kirilowii]
MESGALLDFNLDDGDGVQHSAADNSDPRIVNLNGNGYVPEPELHVVKVDTTGYVPEPKVGMLFDSLEMFMNYYKRYGEKRGFPVCQRSSKVGKNGEVRWVTLTCQRNGKTRSTSENPLPSKFATKTQCKARLNGTIENDGELKGKVRLTSYVLEHNHALVPDNARFFPCNKGLHSGLKRKLEVNEQRRRRVQRQVNSVVLGAAGFQSVSFVGNAARSWLGAGDAAALCKFFTDMQKQNANFWYAIDLDEEGRLRNVLWVDVRSRSLYEQFGDVVMLDTAYLTEKYDIPLAAFVGVNHHGQYILLGCGLLTNESKASFSWLFRNWLACMDYCAPKAIVTDRDTTLQEAVEEVFPEARHRWCLWHIMKKLLEKLRCYSDYQAIKLAIQGVVHGSKTMEEFERKFGSLVEKYSLKDNQWLLTLFTERSHWVPVYVKDIFWAGMLTTERSETMHPYFDGFVSTKTSLKQFLEGYEAIVQSKAEQEAQADYNSFNSVRRCVTKYNIEKQFQDSYTNEKFKEVQDEFAGKMYCNVHFHNKEGAYSIYQVTEDEENLDKENDGVYTVHLNEEDFSVKCICQLYECNGILCKHILAVLCHSKIKTVPPKYITSRWRKDLRRAHTTIRVDKYNSIDDSQRQRYTEMYRQYYEVVDLALGSDSKTDTVLNVIRDLKQKLSETDDVSFEISP